MKHVSRRKRLLAFAAVPVVVASMAVATTTPAQAATPTYVRAGCGSTTGAQTKDGVPLAHCFAMGVADNSGKLAVRAAAAGAPATAITPDQLKTAYSLPDAGAGMTVAIASAAPVKVTMTATPPATWGKIIGTVTDKSGTPLEVIAAEDGYTPALRIVKIVKGDTVETDFALAGDSGFTAAKVRAYLGDTLQK